MSANNPENVGSGKEDTVATTTATIAPRKEPPPEKPADVRRRSLVVLSFWVIVILLGLPIWWKTTSIYRANLPLDEMMDWADGKLTLDAPDLQEQEAQALLRLTQDALDDPGDFPLHRIRLQSPEQTLETISKPSSNAALSIHLTPGESTTSSLHPHAPILEITYPPNSISTSSLASYIASELRSTFAEEQAIVSYLLSASSVSDEQRPQGILQHVTESLAKRMTRSVKYSRTYHLTFSLFTGGSTPTSWDIEAAVDEYMRPVLDMLKPIHNFTIDTQVQLYATPGVHSQVLSKDDLSSFINAAEWPLSPSIGGAPTINFIVYIGNQTIRLGSEAETSQSWLIPQWGSVYLLSPPATTYVQAETLKQPLMTFTAHLLSLLGTPQSGSLPMRLSTLTRIRSADLVLKASSSLGSLARLSSALPSISIPSSVADGVAKTLHHLELACADLGTTESLEHARTAEREAERAFFEKSMVGQLYFPDEHKVAVYLPLLGPVGVPLVMGLLNELKAWKKRRAPKVKET
ncbi:hypothetical protein DL771_009539 [Monosporascus sp. 5C6A]|nr:hypothetical protein DL771_009539 [Monosporascus sp. 5C6A]